MTTSQHAALLGYALAVYGYAALLVPYFLCIAGGRIAGPGLGGSGTASHALAVDGALLVLFAVPHSVMARPWFKGWLRRVVSEATLRSTYVLVTCVTLTALVALWSPWSEPVWEVTHSLGWALSNLVFACGFVLTYAAALALGHADLLGLTPAWRSFQDCPEVPAILQRRGPYRWVRHPLMLGLLLIFWSAPSMTVDRLLFAVAMSVYAALGTWLEERDLLAVHGDDFCSYRRRVPALLPSRKALPHQARADEEDHEVTPRTVGFDFESEHEPFWYDLSVFKTLVLDAYTIVFAEIERFTSNRVRAAIPRIEDAQLARRARSLIAQEATHAAQHESSIRILIAQGFEVAPLQRLVSALLAGGLEPLLARVVEPRLGPSFGLAVVAGVEHWMAVLAEVSLEGDPTQHQDSEMKRLFSWHAAEELEHRAVAFDLFRSFSRSEVMRVAGFLVASLVVLSCSSLGAIVLLAQVRHLTPRGLLEDAVSYLLTRERILIRGTGRFLDYLRSGFHPESLNVPQLARRS